jgi:hypothetical protein
MTKRIVADVIAEPYLPFGDPDSFPWLAAGLVVGAVAIAAALLIIFWVRKRSGK